MSKVKRPRAYNRGYSDGIAGKPELECPYLEGIHARPSIISEWYEGWRNGLFERELGLHRAPERL